MRRDSELSEFRRFVQLSHLPIVDGSIEVRQPPEPDIRCRLQTGEFVAFELVEISNPKNARFAASAKTVHRSIVAAYAGLPPVVRNAFEAKFLHTPLAFEFLETASRSEIQRELPRLLTELAAMPKSGGPYRSFSASVSSVVVAVWERGRPIDPESVNFSLQGFFDPVVPLDAIAGKLMKSYGTPHPIELLAHFGAWALGGNKDYQTPITELVRRRGLGPFRRLWVQDWYGIGLILPDDPKRAT